jgi:SLA1 Homology Domain 1 (SHD1) protein
MWHPIGIATTVSLMCSIALASEAPEKGKAPPRIGDEVSLVQVKATPEAYAGGNFVICGGIKMSNDDNYYCSNGRGEMVYSLHFNDIGKGMKFTNDSADLYLSRQDDYGTTVYYAVKKNIVDALIKIAEKYPESSKLRLARLKVRFDPVAYTQLKRFNVFVVMDVQFASTKDGVWDGEWEDWVIDKATDTLQARAPKERRESRERKDATGKFREWKDDTGKFSVMARYHHYAGKLVVCLELEDGTLIDVPTKRLCKEDRAEVTRRIREERKPKSKTRRR